MNWIKRLIDRYFAYFAYFYRHLRHRILVSLGLSFGTGILDGFGLAMFIPLLSFVAGDGENSKDGLGGMSFVLEFFQSLGITITLYSVLGIIVFFFLLKGIFSFLSIYYRTIVQLYFIKALRFKTADGLAEYGYKNFVEADAGHIQNTMSGEVGRVTSAYNSYFATIQAWAMVAIYLSMATISNPQFAVLVGVGGGLSNLLYRQVYKKTKETSKKITQGGHQFQGVLIQKVAFFKYLKATGYLMPYSKRLKGIINYIEAANKKIGFYNSVLSATKEPINVMVVVFVIVVQVSFFNSNLSGIVLSLLLLYRSLNYVVSIQTSWNQFLNTSGSLENMTDFVKQLEQGREVQGVENYQGPIRSIVLENVNFYYGDMPILRDINLEIKPYTTVAFVGESGSGKTTLVNLLCGLMPVEKGNVRINGIPLKSLNRTSFQQHIGYITQEPVIFTDTIYNNITLWAPKTPENLSRFETACQQASIFEFIQTLSQKYDSQLGNNGIQVSGGQKQRLSIARELFKDIEILVMDEATSALDSEVELAIQQNIDALKGKYTIFIVAHRLSTVRNADHIVVLNKGEIEAQGSFVELMEASVRFRRMVTLQEI
jgi:ABC-type multidrug transport system fused ATPase/permease subunit